MSCPRIGARSSWLFTMPVSQGSAQASPTMSAFPAAWSSQAASSGRGQARRCPRLERILCRAQGFRWRGLRLPTSCPQGYLSHGKHEVLRLGLVRSMEPHLAAKSTDRPLDLSARQTPAAARATRDQDPRPDPMGTAAAAQVAKPIREGASPLGRWQGHHGGVS